MLPWEYSREYGKTYTLEINYEEKLMQLTINQAKPVIVSVDYTANFYDTYGGHDGVIVTVDDHRNTGLLLLPDGQDN